MLAHEREDLVGVRDLAVGEDEELPPRPFRHGRLQDRLQGPEDLGPAQVGLELLHVRARLGEALLVVGPALREELLERRAEADDVEEDAGREAPEAELQGVAGLLDGASVHRAGAVDDEDDLALRRVGRGDSPLAEAGSEGEHRDVGAVGRPLDEDGGPLGLGQPDDENEVAVEGGLRGAEGDRSAGAVEVDRDGVRGRLDSADRGRHVEQDQERQTVGNAESDGRVQRLLGSPADAAAVLGGGVAGRHRRREGEAEAVPLRPELGDRGEPDDDLLAGREVSDARREDVGPLLVEEVGAVAGRDRLVVHLERLLPLHDLSGDDPSVDEGLEAADGGGLVEGKDVGGFEGRLPVVAVALREGDAGGEALQLDFHRHAEQGNGGAVGIETAAGSLVHGAGHLLAHSSSFRKLSRHHAASSARAPGGGSFRPPDTRSSRPGPSTTRVTASLET